MILVEKSGNSSSPDRNHVLITDGNLLLVRELGPWRCLAERQRVSRQRAF